MNCKVLITDKLNNRVIGLMSLLGVLASLKRCYLHKISESKWVYTVIYSYIPAWRPQSFDFGNNRWFQVIEKNQNQRSTRSGLKNQNQKNHLVTLIQKPQRIIEFYERTDDFLSNYLTFSKNN